MTCQISQPYVESCIKYDWLTATLHRLRETTAAKIVYLFSSLFFFLFKHKISYYLFKLRGGGWAMAVDFSELEVTQR